MAFAHQRGDGVGGRCRARDALARGRVGVLARAATDRGRTVGADAGGAVLRPHRRDHEGVQRPDDRARIRRRFLPRPRRDGLLLPLRRSTPLSTGAGRRSRADHAGLGRPRPIRGRSCHARRALVDLRSRASSRSRRPLRRDERVGRDPAGRVRGAADDRLGSRLLLDAEDLPRRLEALLARVGPAVDALGRIRGGRRGPRPGRHPPERAAGRRPGRRGVDLPARVEPGRRPALRLGPDRLVEPVSGARRHGGAAAPRRGGVRLAPMGVRDGQVRLPGRWTDRVRLGARRCAARGRARPRVGRADRPRRAADGAAARA